MVETEGSKTVGDELKPGRSETKDKHLPTKAAGTAPRRATAPSGRFLNVDAIASTRHKPKKAVKKSNKSEKSNHDIIIHGQKHRVVSWYIAGQQANSQAADEARVYMALGVRGRDVDRHTLQARIGTAPKAII